MLMNAERLEIDLSVAEDLILSHHHADHTGGLETLRRELSKRNPAALSRIHVATGIFGSRPRPDGGERNLMVALRDRIEETGAAFIVHDRPTEISPGGWYSSIQIIPFRPEASSSPLTWPVSESCRGCILTVDARLLAARSRHP